jgi:hypothetical protein
MSAKHEAAEALKEVAAHNPSCIYGQNGSSNCWCPAETNIRYFLDALEDDPDDSPVTEKLAVFLRGLPVTKG